MKHCNGCHRKVPTLVGIVCHTDGRYNLAAVKKLQLAAPISSVAWSDRHRPKSMLIYSSKVLADFDEFENRLCNSRRQTPSQNPHEHGSCLLLRTNSQFDAPRPNFCASPRIRSSKHRTRPRPLRCSRPAHISILRSSTSSCLGAPTELCSPSGSTHIARPYPYCLHLAWRRRCPGSTEVTPAATYPSHIPFPISLYR